VETCIFFEAYLFFLQPRVHLGAVLDHNDDNDNASIRKSLLFMCFLLLDLLLLVLEEEAAALAIQEASDISSSLLSSSSDEERPSGRQLRPDVKKVHESQMSLSLNHYDPTSMIITVLFL